MATRNEYIDRLLFCFINLRKGIIHQDSLEECSLPLGQNAAFMMIDHVGSLSVGQLAKQLSITSGAVTQLIDPLVSRGFVERTPDSKDKRTINLSLTKKGKVFRSAMLGAKQKKARHVLAALTDDELQIVTKLMEKVANAKEDSTSEEEG